MKETSERSHVAPEGWHTLTPPIVVNDANQLVEFFKQVFGATGKYREQRPPEIRVGDSVIMISGAGLRNVMTAFLYVYVNDANVAYLRALTAGARFIEAPFDPPYGDRRCMVEDQWENTGKSLRNGSLRILR